MKAQKNLFTFLLIVVLLFSLVSCNFGPDMTPIESGEETSTEISTEASAAETLPSVPGSCLIGTWSLTDFTAYMASLEANIGTMTNNDFVITSGESSGLATFVFNADNTAVFSAENFTQSYTMTTNVSETPVEIPLVITINGTSTSAYSTEGDTISFSDQDNGDIVIAVDVMGSSTDMDQSLFGQPDTVQLYQYACVDANTLSLKVIAIEDMDLDPLILTRVP